jgi:hypothetical protein
MTQMRGFFRRHRLAALALLASAVLHAAVLRGIPERIESIEPQDGVAYTATIDPEAAVIAAAPTPAPRPKPAPRRAKPRPKAPPLIEPAALDSLGTDGPQPVKELASIEDIEKALEAPPPDAPKEKLAMAAPTAADARPSPDPFPTDALPESLSISYNLTSAFADGKADYQWTRDGDSYRIHGEAQAEGFFTLFLEGRIVQETRGTVTPQGLRPESFVERRPGANEEGLQFDWKQHQVTFDRGPDNRKTTAFAGNTVDWLSMIFQLAHVPPKPRGDTLEMAVFTQRKMYAFKLRVLGVEEIEIPMGRVRAMHLQHVDEKDAGEIVDVWLGVDQHFLPVKMRYPVAKNRLMVEQSATSVTTR